MKSKKKAETPVRPKLKKTSDIRIIDIPNDLFIENRKVFNCGIADYREKTFMFYRYEKPYGDYNTELGVCELGTDYYPKQNTNRRLNIVPWTSKVTTYDDPRAFVFRDKMYFMFAQGMVVPYQNYNGWCCSLGVCKLEGDTLTIPVIPDYGQNVNASNKGRAVAYATEKNWMPLVHKDRLFMVYKLNPFTVVEMDADSGQCREVHREIKYDTSFWKYGDFLGGGTPFVEYDGFFYSFFHSFTIEMPNTPSARRYHTGLIKLDREMKPVSMSKDPIMSGEWNEAQDLRPPDNWWKPNVVFPCGLVMRKIEGVDHFCVSYGWQDCRCKIAMVPVKSAIAGLKAMKPIV